MDSLSFKSTKAHPEDLEWCHRQIEKYGMDEKEIINFGYGLTPKTGTYLDYIKTGLKTYVLEDRMIKASYIVVDDDNDDLDKIANILRNELNNKVAAWCFMVSNVSAEHTRILLVTQDYVLSQTVDKLLSRGQNVIPAVMAFLSAKNDGAVTKTLIEKKLEIATMESCTSDLIASNITDYEGASAILRGSCITYSNYAKILAGVYHGVLEEYGVYSPETAFEMALAAKMQFDADIGVGITGYFSNVDPANHDSVAGVIYYEILQSGDENPIKLVFPNTNAPGKR